MKTLEELVASAPGLANLDLQGRLQWLEDAAKATEHSAQGPEAERAALHLRAALGAIVRFSQAPPAAQQDPKAQVELDALLRTLMVTATASIYRALAAQYDALVQARAPHRGACAEIRDVFLEAAGRVEEGKPMGADLSQRLEAARKVTSA